MLTILSENKCFDGVQKIYSHFSTETKCTMRFGVFIPPQASLELVPVLYWLSGLSCTEENFIIKAGAQRVAAELGLMIVTPDTSPRALNIEGESENDNVGLGAGFYVDATEVPWSHGYRMYSYVAKELPALIEQHFPVDVKRIGIMGHSMGGHGALMIALKNQDYFRSVSAFAPICALSRSPWGEKALTHYLGPDKAKWQDYDVSALIHEYAWQGPELFISQGRKDPFLDTQLKPELLIEACKQARVPLRLEWQDGYDHGYFFIASFIEKHLRFHAGNLRALG